MAATTTARTAKFVPPDPPKTPKSAATREHLLQVAGDLFMERGYQAVSVRDLARAAGLSKSAMYGHYRSKGQLLVEVIRWKQAAREHDPKFLARASDEFAGFALFVSEDGRDVRRLELEAAVASRHDDDVAAGMREYYSEREAAIRAAMTQTVDAESLAFLVSAISDGVGTKEAIGIPAPDPERWTALLTAMFDAVMNVE
jgi:AcrR family transcriptional regulator